jgi:hypothetical protein
MRTLKDQIKKELDEIYIKYDLEGLYWFMKLEAGEPIFDSSTHAYGERLDKIIMMTKRVIKGFKEGKYSWKKATESNDRFN